MDESRQTETQYLVRKIETCQECDGEGILSNLNWQEINQANNEWMEEHGITTFTDAAQADWERRIKEKWPYRDPPPEEEPCHECEGTGQVKSWVDLGQALQEMGVMDILSNFLKIEQNRLELEQAKQLKEHLERGLDSLRA